MNRGKKMRTKKGEGEEGRGLPREGGGRRREEAKGAGAGQKNTQYRKRAVISGKESTPGTWTTQFKKGEAGPPLVAAGQA